MNFRALGVGAVMLVLVGCGHPAEQKTLSEIKGSPDIVAQASQPGSKSRAFDLRAFQVSPIWGGANAPIVGSATGSSYRVKITLWDSDPRQGDTALAEIFFRDQEQVAKSPPISNPDPNDPKDPNNPNAQGTGPGRTYRIDFPIATLEAVIQTLRFANGDVYLYYHEGQWAIGTAAAEFIGSN